MKILAYVEAERLELIFILDTHPHADHFLRRFLSEGTNRRSNRIGAHIGDVQKLWKDIYNLARSRDRWFAMDRLFAHATVSRSARSARVCCSRLGHTLASVTYVIGDAAFIHDTLFMPDSGTARGPIFRAAMRGCSGRRSRTFSLFRSTRPLHRPRLSAPAAASRSGKAPSQSKKGSNLHITGKSETEFVALRDARDHMLRCRSSSSMPCRSISRRAPPEPEDNGVAI